MSGARPTTELSSADRIALAEVRGEGDEVFDIHQLATYLNVSWRTIQEWEAAKTAPPRLPLPSKRMRRWRKSTVDRWMDDIERRAATG